MDLHPQVIAGHIALGEVVSRLDQQETHMWVERSRGVYVASCDASDPFLPIGTRTGLAEGVLLLVLAIGLEVRQ